MREPMQWTFPIGRLFGAAIRVHIMLPIVLLGVYLKALGENAKQQPPIPGMASAMAIVLGLLFLSILLHEYGHVFAARSVGGDADEVILWPLGGLALCELPPQPRAHFLTALAGPLVNLMLCVLCAAYLVGQLVWPPLNPIAAGNFPYAPKLVHLATGDLVEPSWHLILAFQLFWVNWVLFLFNMILPAWPLDVGRMVHAVLWARTDERQASGTTAYIGFVVMLILCIAAIYVNDVLLFALCLFIYINCRQLLMQAELGRDEMGFSEDSPFGSSLREEASTRRPKLGLVQRWKQRRAAQQAQLEQQQKENEERRLDELLDKVQRLGRQSLTAEEERFLNRVSTRYRNNRP
jgi:Zn-dependent protease